MLHIYTLEQAEKWDSIVRSINNYDVYWLSGYVKAFKIHGDGEPLLFYYEQGETRGINVVMKRDVAKIKFFSGIIGENQCFDFSTPYGYGGWIIEGENKVDLFQKYREWLEENSIICEFVRFHPMLKNHMKSRTFYEITQLGEVVHMDVSSPEAIWNNLSAKNRNVIRKAIKNDISIYNGRFPEIYERFLPLYNQTMRKDNADAYYYFEPEFFRSLLLDLPDNAQVFWAEKDKQIIAASIMLSANGYMNYHLSGSLREYSSLAPSNLLLYKAALWACANGCRTLYLGGGLGSEEDGLFKFKRAFYKGELNHFYIGKAIYNRDKYDDLVEMRGELVSTFFPKYRA